MLFLQSGQRGERPRIRLNVLWRLENRTRLARVGIEPKDEEFGRQRAQIDDTADERLRPVPAALRPFGSLFVGLVVAGLALDGWWRRREHQVDILFDLVDEWLERHHAVLAHRRRHPPRNMQSS